MTLPAPERSARPRTWYRAAVQVEQIDARNWRLLAPLAYVDRYQRRWVIPEGFVTDFASVPKPLTGLIPRSGRHNAAAVLHDWLYVTRPLPRKEADRLFLEAMADSGVTIPHRGLMWAAVRLGGWAPWHWQSARGLPLHHRPFVDFYDR